MQYCKRVSGLRHALFIVFLTLASPCFAESDDFLDTSVYTHPTQPAVRFIHDSHNENAGIEECQRCHHLYEDGLLIKSESSDDTPCSDCHSPQLFHKEVTLTTAFHNRCKGCHLNEKKGPVMCGECHKKNVSPDSDK